MNFTQGEYLYVAGERHVLFGQVVKVVFGPHEDRGERSYTVDLVDRTWAADRGCLTRWNVAEGALSRRQPIGG